MVSLSCRSTACRSPVSSRTPLSATNRQSTRRSSSSSVTISRGAKPSASRSRACSRTSAASALPRRSLPASGSASSRPSSAMTAGIEPSCPRRPRRSSDGTSSSRSASETTSSARSQAEARISAPRSSSAARSLELTAAEAREGTLLRCRGLLHPNPVGKRGWWCRFRTQPVPLASAGARRHTTRKGAALSVVSMRELLEAGVHFGHQTRRWNPKMKRFIFTERGGIYIIDLQQTLRAARGGARLRAQRRAAQRLDPLRRHEEAEPGRDRRARERASACRTSTTAGSAACSRTGGRCRTASTASTSCAG